MAISKKVEELTSLLEPAVVACGFELWGLEFFQQGRHSVLRLFIDTDRESGVGVDDCSAVSHQVSGVLDVEDPIAGEYTLEVSSPGWDRGLFKPSQYQRFVGEEANLRLNAPLQGRRRYKGAIQSADDTQVSLLVDGVVVQIPFASVDKANIVPNL
ncbi:ribosome maturation factor RimP [Amnimonas aquatica]|uniref:Ribosome maturation factor RimP n=1 Tax=Amnimonas aquatica TaxID=2094561 RepID=A0A2P6AVK1_9GAMM|nr:ribosome maturation factor RimP [Amnimonas aquatica]